MKVKELHPWKVSLAKAKKIQLRLRRKLNLKKSIKHFKYLCAGDTTFKGDKVYAAVAVFKFPSLELLEYQTAKTRLCFPYVPGFLAFREGKALLKAIKKLKTNPDVFIFDGHGIAHPYHFGLASHLGVILNKPSIGCAKSKLIGDYKEPPKERGEYSLLKHRGKTIGAALRTNPKAKPIFVSSGHNINLTSAIKIVLACSVYRIPEPLRYVHKKCSALC